MANGAKPANGLAAYVAVTAAYWAFMLTDGVLRMLVLLHFHTLGFSPTQLAYLFLLYEFMGVVTNLSAGWIARRFGLNAVGALTLNPAHAPGARRVAALRETLAQLGVACVFTEPQFEPRLVRVLIEGTGVRTGVLRVFGERGARGCSGTAAVLFAPREHAVFEQSAHARVACETGGSHPLAAKDEACGALLR